jgi:hypothetical protein
MKWLAQAFGRRSERQNALAKLILLDHLTDTSEELAQTSEDKGSLYETERRQNIRAGLTHISDKAFYFFTKLCSATLFLQTPETLTAAGENIQHFIKEHLQSNTDLKVHWLTLFPETTSLPTWTVDEESVHTLVLGLFNDTVDLFSRVMINQYRKDLLSAMRERKTEALRSEVGPRKRRKKVPTSQKDIFTNPSLYNDLKAHVITSGKLPAYTKTVLCHEYQVF